MHEDHRLTPGEQEFEAALKRLHPAGHAIDRDRLMFTAGQRVAQRAQRGWQAATGALTVLLGASWALQIAVPAPPQVADVPPAQLEPLNVAMSPLPPAVADVPPELWPPVPRYVHLRNAIVAEGLDALPGDFQFAATGPEDGAGDPVTKPASNSDGGGQT